MTNVLGLSALGGLLAWDGTSLGQTMSSRPLVASTLTGWLLGDAAAGFLVGAIMEIYLLVSIPVGGARFPEAAPASIVAATVATLGGSPGALALGVGLGLVWGQVGAFTLTLMRGVNGRFVPEPTMGRITPSLVVRAHLGALAIDFFRGALVTGLGVTVGSFALPLARFWPLSGPDTVGLLMVGAAVSAGILLRNFGGARQRGLLFLAGAVIGLLGGVLL